MFKTCNHVPCDTRSIGSATGVDMYAQLGTRMKEKLTLPHPSFICNFGYATKGSFDVIFDKQNLWSQQGKTNSPI